MATNFKTEFKRSDIPDSTDLQASIIDSAKLVPQQVESESQELKGFAFRFFSLLETIKKTIKPPVMVAALASVLAISTIVLFNKPVPTDDIVSVASLADKFSASDYAWQEMVLNEDEFWLAQY